MNRLAQQRQPVFIFSTSLLVSKIRLFILLKISKQKTTELQSITQLFLLK